VREIVKNVDKEMYTDIFTALGMPSEANAPKTGEPTVGFSITTMLHHTVQL